MLRRHDFVTPYIDGIRFFDKPPLMYWMAAASMHVFGVKDWAARLPLALCVLALLLSTYALGIRLFRGISPAQHPDRGGFYAALALATSIGPYLYTRFYIPDILLALWMTLAVHLFLIALDRIEEPTQPQIRVNHENPAPPQNRVAHPLWLPTKGGLFARKREPHSSPARKDVISTEAAHSFTVSSAAESAPVSPDPLSPAPASSFRPKRSEVEKPASLPKPSPSRINGMIESPLLPCLAFAAVMALNVLTKGLIGLVFPIAFVLLYLAITRQLPLIPKLHPISSTLVFLAIAAPWHILAALRNPAIPLPPGLGLPTTGGWAWFYLYNEHIARFLSKRIPHDYGQTPLWLFWLYLAIWVMPWTTFLPSAVAQRLRTLTKTGAAHPLWLPTKGGLFARTPGAPPLDSEMWALFHEQEATLALLLWAAIVLLFFSLSARQEYYSLPAIPALALMAGALLARADACTDLNQSHPSPLSPNHRHFAESAPATAPEDNRHFDRSSGFIAAQWRNLLLYRKSPSSHKDPAQTSPGVAPEDNRHFDRSSGFIAAQRRNLLLYRKSPSSHKDPAQTSPGLASEDNRHFDRSSGFIAAQWRNLLLYRKRPSPDKDPAQSALNWHLYFLVPLTTLIAVLCAYFALTAPHPAPGTDLSTLLAANPKFYNLSLGHLFDLTGAAMGLFRGPLAAVAFSMVAIGLGSYLLRRAGRTYAANLTLAAAMTVTLLAAHEGLARFYPILGSKSLAESINHTKQADPRPADLILLDGELTSGSTLIFYTQKQVHLIGGRVNGLWYGSFWPDAPAVFESEDSLRRLWASPRRVFLFTYNPAARIRDLAPYAPVHTLAAAGGKTILTNH